MLGSNNILKINNKKMNINKYERTCSIFILLEEFAAFIQPDVMLHRVQFRSLSLVLDVHSNVFRLKEKKKSNGLCLLFCHSGCDAVSKTPNSNIFDANQSPSTQTKRGKNVKEKVGAR